jgi:hypothetical protein
VAEEEPESVSPPYVQALATLGYTIRLQRRVGILLGVAGLSLFAYQQMTIWNLYGELRTKDYLVVPGAADFVSVRPNLVGDRTIVAFARYFTERMVSVSHRDIEARYGQLEKYMVPALWVHMQRELEQTAAMFKAIHVSEVASIRDIEAERRNLSNGKSGFVATVKVVVDRYVGERKHESKEEVVTIIFQTSHLSGDEPWLFEVVEFVRRSPAEHRQYVIALRGEK